MSSYSPNFACLLDFLPVDSESRSSAAATRRGKEGTSRSNEGLRVNEGAVVEVKTSENAFSPD